MLDFKDIAKIFEKIELRLVDSLKRNLHKHKSWEKEEGFNWSAWQAEKLRNLETFRRNNAEIMDEYVDVIDDETRQLMGEQFQEGEELVDSQFEQIKQDNPEADTSSVITSDNFFGINEEKMQSLITDITELEKKAETAALRMTDDVYRQTLNRVQLDMATGSMTLTQAIDNAVSDFLDKGINCIEYKDGRRVNIADYVRMALRTTSTRASLQGKAKRFAELGYDTVMTSQYSMCSKTCEPYQGRVYIDNVFTVWHGEVNGDYGKSNYCGKWFMLLSVAISNGLFHPNCRHSLLQYIDGVTKIPEPIDSKELQKRRQLEAKQRELEREIRKYKRYVAGTQDPDTVKAYRKKLREKQSELKSLIDENSEILRRDYSREKSNPLTDKDKDDIIKAEEIRKLLRNKIESGELPLTINPEKQMRHILPSGVSEMPDRRSHLIISFQEAQEEIIKRHLTGNIHVRISQSGIQFKETIESDRYIAFDARSKTISNRATIHYSKTGTHLVPAKRRDKN